jgi:hypothetical protein
MCSSKRFNRTLYEQYDTLGKSTAIHFLGQLGYTLHDDAEAYKSHDLIMKDKDGKLIKVEVEVARAWKDTMFPFRTTTIPYRKKDSKSDVFIQTSLNGNALIFCPMKQVLEADVITKNTIYTNDERFFSIPISKLRQYYCEDGVWYYEEE